MPWWGFAFRTWSRQSQARFRPARRHLWRLVPRGRGQARGRVLVATQAQVRVCHVCCGRAARAPASADRPPLITVRLPCKEIRIGTRRSCGMLCGLGWRPLGVGRSPHRRDTVLFVLPDSSTPATLLPTHHPPPFSPSAAAGGIGAVSTTNSGTVAAASGGTAVNVYVMTVGLVTR